MDGQLLQDFVLALTAALTTLASVWGFTRKRRHVNGDLEADRIAHIVTNLQEITSKRLAMPEVWQEHVRNEARAQIALAFEAIQHDLLRVKPPTGFAGYRDDLLEAAGRQLKAWRR